MITANHPGGGTRTQDTDAFARIHKIHATPIALRIRLFTILTDSRLIITI
ncbi:MAG: hypothetical protein LBE33_01780 [Zoogloeaceae bacterium]|jgi:hypothetical protein|nr:hypothetical protein [Zoogloeaceae bacterium]